MECEYKMSIEALAMRGADYRSAKVLVMDTPWHLLQETFEAEENDDYANLLQKWKERNDRVLQEEEAKCKSEAGISGQGNNYFADAKISINSKGQNPLINYGLQYQNIRMEDPDYMKQVLKEWARAVASHVRLLDAAFIYPIT